MNAAGRTVVGSFPPGDSEDLQDDISLIAQLAFARAKRDNDDAETRHLALLPKETLELDLSDPAQRVFADYELLELIGEGGMGVVYRARQISLDREVAVKLLAAGPWASTQFVERFRREAQNAARMQHPNIVAIYEVGDAEELQFFSMRLVRGDSLAALLKRNGKLAPLRAAQLLRTIAEAVDYAHRLGVLHLDLKPGNVLLDENGTPHVADFGLARRLDQGLAADNTEVSGTPSYMAPEQATAGAQRITPATDVWGLGAILYELVCGVPPFLDVSPQATLKLVVTGTLHNPRRYTPQLPADLEAIILKSMSRDIGARYASARALADDLSRLIEGRAVSARPLNGLQRVARWTRREPKLAGTALAALLALLAGLAATTQQWRNARHNAQRAEQERRLAEDNAMQSAQRLWTERRDGAMRLIQDGKGFDALLPLITNVEEQERAGIAEAGGIERREIGIIESQGVTLIDRMIITDASPMAAALSADGSLLAIALNDVSVRWYDTATLHERGRVDLLDMPTSDKEAHVPQFLRFIDNHRLMVTLDWYTYSPSPTELDSVIVDLDNGSAVAPPESFGELSHAQFDSSGRYALLFNKHGQYQYWQVAPWKPLSPLAAPLSEDSTLPYWLSRDGTHALELYQSNADFATFDPRNPSRQTRQKLPPHVSLTAWAESRDGRRLALGDAEGRVLIVDVTTWQARSLPVPSGREVSWLAFSEDDAWLGIARVDGAAFALDVASGATLHSSQMHHDFALRHVALSRRDRMLIASGAGETAIWRLPESGGSGLQATRLVANPSHSPKAGLYWASASFATGLLATADSDGEVRLWRLPRPKIQSAHAPIAFHGRFDGAHVADVEWDHVRVAEVGGNAVTPWAVLPQRVAFAELVDAARTLVASAGPQLHVLDARTLKPRLPPIELPANPLELVVDADGKRAVMAFGANESSGFREHIEAYDLASGVRLPEGASVAGLLRQFELSEDGSRLVTVGRSDGATDLFETASLRRIGHLPHERERPVVRAAFAGNDALWVVLRDADPLQGDNSDLLRWQAATGSVLEQRHVAGVWPVGLATSGGVPILAGKEQVIRDPGAPAARASERLSLGEATTVFAFSHDRRLLAHAFGRDVFLYDAATMAPVSAPLHTDMGLIDIITGLAFANDDRSLLGRTATQKWFVWPVAADDRPSAELLTEAVLLTRQPRGQKVLLAVDPAEKERLRRRDAGNWPQPEARPQPRLARKIAGVGVPARPPGLDPLLLDLTSFYNAAPESSYNLIDSVMPNLRGVPLGTPRLDGVDYDLRGAVELRWGVGGRLGSQSTVQIANAMRGLRVPPVPVAAFHVLLFASVPLPENKPRDYASLRLNYHDGTHARLPMRTNIEIRGLNELDNKTPIALAPDGDLELLGELQPRIFNNPRLVNPHPERLVDSIDVEAFAHGWSAFAVFAITAEPVIAGGQSRSPSTGGGSNDAPPAAMQSQPAVPMVH